MSILMDALKQQNTLQAAAPDKTAFWRKLALVLALVVALLSGALLAYWLQPQPVNVQPATTVVLQPAKPADILAVLQAEAAPQAEASGQRVAAEVLTTAKVQDNLAPAKAMPMVTATSDNAVDSVPAQKQPAALDRQQNRTVKHTAVASTDAEVVVSDELRDKFSQALQATERGISPARNRSQNAPAQDISMLDAATLRHIPALRFDAHVYATSATQRWVKVNGKTLQEGQWITADIRIREITQQYVLLELGTQLFSMTALSEWPAS